MRVACIRALKSEWQRLRGGIEPSDLARQQAPDLVCGSGVPAKRRYLRLMTRIPICDDSRAARFERLGEYVAAGRAILSEPLVHQVLGNFIAGRNYLTFAYPEACVEKAVILLRNRPLRETMMLRNPEYFRQFATPEAMVLNAVSLATAEQASRGLGTVPPAAGRMRIPKSMSGGL